MPTNTGASLQFGVQRKGNDVNPGWNPITPTGPLAKNITYTTANLEPWEAPLRNGSHIGTDTTFGYYRYTRGGLKGIDVGAPEPHFPN